MTRDRMQAAGAALASSVLVLLVVIDASVPPDAVILTALFGLAPLIACAVVSAGGTAAIASAAVAAALLSGTWNHSFGTAQQTVRVLNVVLVGAAAVAIAAVRVHRERHLAEVSLIAEVAQRAILPILPAHAGPVGIAARYHSAARGALVGGDLYDCYTSRDHVRLLIGDVRGKGIAGVEQAARVIRVFRQAAALQPTLPEVAAEMDDYLAGFFGEEEFVTALLLDVTEPGVMRVVSAGHPGPQLAEASGTHILDLPAGLPLGLGLGQLSGGYAETVLPWRPGDRLLMYTDGLTEARNPAGEFFPVLSLGAQMRVGSVDDVLEGTVAAVTDHVHRGRLEDDLALVVVEHLPVPTSATVTA
ncbi:PP2C family protein-serine/threonine phosphatase [Nocardioides sp. AN3]